MNRHLRAASAGTVAVMAATLLAACDSDPQPAETVTVTASEATPSSSPSASPTPTTTEPSEAPSPLPTPSSGPTADPSAVPTTAAPGGPGTYPDGEASLDLTQTTETGVTVDLTRVAVAGDTLSLDVTALNAGPDLVQLANGGDAFPDAISVTIDAGPPLLYRPAADNPSLEIPSGSELTGTVSFVGRIPEDATTVDVAFNGRAVLDSRITPQVTFEDVPLP